MVDRGRWGGSALRDKLSEGAEDRRDIIASLGKRGDAAVALDGAGAGIVGRQGERQVVVIAVEQESQEAGPAKDALSGVEGILHAEHGSGCRHQLHQAHGAGGTDRARIVAGLAPRDRTQQERIEPIGGGSVAEQRRELCGRHGGTIENGHGRSGRWPEEARLNGGRLDLSGEAVRGRGEERLPVRAERRSGGQVSRRICVRTGRRRRPGWNGSELTLDRGALRLQ